MTAGRRRTAVVFLLGAASATLGCASHRPAVWEHPSLAEWSAATRALGRLRSLRRRSPYVASISMTLTDRPSGRVVDGRGAIAVDGGAKALRMILVGPGGTTLLDAWATPWRWRVAVPALDIVRRGGADEPNDLPIGFLRWWFFAPFEGTLFGARVSSAAGSGVASRGGVPTPSVWLLRQAGAVVDVRRGQCPGGEALLVTRRTLSRVESVEECGANVELGPTPGDAVVYADERRGLRVAIQVEAIESSTPDPEAFRDPDGRPEGGP